MTVFERVSFTFENKEYEIRTMKTNDGYTVRVFHNNEPANRLYYEINSDTASDFQTITGENSIQKLQSIARSDIEENKQEELDRAIEE